MKSRLLLNLLLIGVLALLGAYLFLNQEPEIVKSDQLVDLDKNEIDRITIVRENSFEMDFKKKTKSRGRLQNRFGRAQTLKL